MVVEYALLDLYHVFVEVIFGNYLFAIIGLTTLFAVMGFLMRMSAFLVTIISVMFLGTMMMGYVGSLVAVFMFTISASYFAYAIIRWVQGYYVS